MNVKFKMPKFGRDQSVGSMANIDMKTSKLWILAAILVMGLLSSCTIQEIVSDTVEYETYKGLQKAQKQKGIPSAKQQAKEAEQLKKEGKCPTCRGAGKTPDGRYTCTVCNGTGKYQEKTE